MISFDAGPEKIAALPISLDSSVRRSLFYVCLGNLAAGDVICINSFFQVSLPHQYNVMVGKYLTLNAGSVSHGYAIHSANAKNITPAIHHDDHPMSMTYVVPAAKNNAYLTLVGYAAASNAQPYHALIVDQGKGWLNGFLVKP